MRSICEATRMDRVINEKMGRRTGIVIELADRAEYRVYCKVL